MTAAGAIERDDGLRGNDPDQQPDDELRKLITPEIHFFDDRSAARPSRSYRFHRHIPPPQSTWNLDASYSKWLALGYAWNVIALKGVDTLVGNTDHYARIVDEQGATT